MLRIFLTVLPALLVAFTASAEQLANSEMPTFLSPAPVIRDPGALVGSGPLQPSDLDDHELGPKMLPAPVIAILIGAGMQIGRAVAKQIIKSIGETSAKKAAQNFSKQLLEKKGKKCFSVDGANGQRLLLGLDRETVLFAGDHDAYMRAIKELCH